MKISEVQLISQSHTAKEHFLTQLFFLFNYTLLTLWLHFTPFISAATWECPSIHNFSDWYGKGNLYFSTLINLANS